MRSDATQYDLIAPRSLDAVLQILADSPNRYAPIAGGTELMVAFGAGRLQPKKLVSLWNLSELRFIEERPDAIIIGAGSTFTDLRRNSLIARELPLLSQAASWTGSIANQNRATLGGNIVNASPAADSPPALLAYDATLTLVSTRGTRSMPYRDFHLSYKKTALAEDELLHSITVFCNFNGYIQWIRKVGHFQGRDRRSRPYSRRHHRRHTHWRRQSARNPGTSYCNRAISSQPGRYSCDHRCRTRRNPYRSPSHRRHSQHSEIPRRGCR